MDTLRFDLKNVLTLIKHALNAPDHKCAYVNGLNEVPKPGLWLVGDDGIYLMSNGLPMLKEHGMQAVVYAEGWMPNSDTKDTIQTQKENNFLEVLYVAKLKAILAKKNRKGMSTLCVNFEQETLDLYLD